MRINQTQRTCNESYTNNAIMEIQYLKIFYLKILEDALKYKKNVLNAHLVLQKPSYFI